MTIDTLKNSAFMALAAGVLALPIAANAAGDMKAQTSAGAGTAVTQEHFAQADADKSGTLSEAEYEKFADAQEDAGIDIASDFDDLDANNDNTLTVAEFRAQKVDGKGVNDNQ